MQRAPESPSSEELYQRYPLSDGASLRIDRIRDDYSFILNRPSEFTLGILGYCSLPGTDQREVVLSEAVMVSQTSDELLNARAAHRQPPWKPRTDPEEYHGEDTTNPEGAFSTIAEQAEKFSHVAIEIGYTQMIGRYAHMLSFAWMGSRNVEDRNLAEVMALHNPKLPLGIKNGLEGDLEPAIEQVAHINMLRQYTLAPAVLIFRGGRNAQTPELWEKEYLRAWELTGGKFIVDAAHGSEMAHDPNKKFEKSEKGQVRAIRHINQLAQKGYSPGGIMIEAGGTKSRTDPNISLKIALDGFAKLVKIKRLQQIS